MNLHLIELAQDRWSILLYWHISSMQRRGMPFNTGRQCWLKLKKKYQQCKKRVFKNYREKKKKRNHFLFSHSPWGSLGPPLWLAGTATLWEASLRSGPISLYFTAHCLHHSPQLPCLDSPLQCLSGTPYPSRSALELPGHTCYHCILIPSNNWFGTLD